VPVATVSQTKSLSFPASAWVFWENLSIPKSNPVLGRVSSTIGTLTNEIIVIPEGKRRGGGLIPFDPPRLRTVYKVQDVSITFPPLVMIIGIETEGTTIEGIFGFIAQIVIGGVTCFVQSPPSSTFAWTKKGFPLISEKKPETLQLQINQPIIVPPGTAIEVRIDAYFEITNLVKAEGVEIISLQENSPATPINTTILYEMEYKKGKRE
jgi:hypothetical protein